MDEGPRPAGQPEPEQLGIPYFYSQGHRVVLADGATITGYDDGIGNRLQVDFTRNDNSPDVELIPVKALGGGAFEVTGKQEFKGTPKKFIEASVTMRPDHAFNIAVAILHRIASLPEERRRLYQIPEFEVPQDQQEQQP